VPKCRTRCHVSDCGSAFGRDDPRKMSPHFFYGCLHIDYASAVRAEIARQNYSVCPRYWYVDARFACAHCGDEFVFSAAEQRVWFEDHGFWVDAFPKHCLSCRRALRELKTLRQEYDAGIAEALRSPDLERKQRLAEVIDRLYEVGGEQPDGIHDNRRLLAVQIAKLDPAA